MKNKPAYTEPLSQVLRRHPHGDKAEITSAVRWVALSALFLFLALIVLYIFVGVYINALASAVAVILILVSIHLLKQDAVSVPSTILAITIITLITWLATFGQGLYDIGVLGYPVILIVAGLILRGRVIIYLAFLIILCLAWLAFGDYFDWYQLITITQNNIQDFFIASIIILIAGNAVYRLVRNVFHNLSKAENEIERREKAEQEREALIHQLKSKNQELDRFAVSVSHDLKTPLITMAGYLGYLEKDALTGNTERIGRDIAQINDAAKKMGRLVDELLDLSRVGRIMNKPVDVPFEEMAREALSAADGLLKARQVQVRMDAGFPVVHVDRVRIVQVIQNLVTNAVKFMGGQTDPLVEIGFKEMDGAQIFFVRDNGMGIAAQHHEQIFGLFTKLDPNTAGTGLGLGLVKRIIEVHGGKIWVESEPGKGATFYFTLAEQTPREIS